MKSKSIYLITILLLIIVACKKESIYGTELSEKELKEILHQGQWNKISSVVPDSCHDPLKNWQVVNFSNNQVSVNYGAIVEEMIWDLNSTDHVYETKIYSNNSNQLIYNGPNCPIITFDRLIVREIEENELTLDAIFENGIFATYNYSK